MKNKAVFIVALVIVTLHACQDYQFVYGDTCLDACPPNTVTVNRNGAWICDQCDISKLLVISEDQTRCQCSIQSYPLPGYQQCAPCHYSCLTCSGPSQKQCLTCSSDFIQTFRYQTGNSCPCQYGYVDVAGLQTLKCTKCHPDCSSCRGPEDTDCIDCAVGRKKDQFQLCACINSFVSNDDGSCSCPSPLAVMQDGVCREPTVGCGFNEEKAKSNASATKGKNQNVASVAISSVGCTCIAGLVKVKGNCVSCPQNHVYNSKSGKCQCDSKGNKHKGKCIICPTNQVFNRRTGECNCKKNFFKTETNACISCPSKMIYTEGACRCAYNHYLVNNRCRRCTKKVDNPSCQQAHHGADKPRRLTAAEL